MSTKQSPIPTDVLASLDQSTLDLVERVVEEAWQEFSRRKGSEISEERMKLTRELMAHRVVARVFRGETDPRRLKDHALWGF